MSLEVWLIQDGKPHQAHVQSSSQAYMRELEFRIDETNKEGINYHNYRNYGDGLPLYINRGVLEGLKGSFFLVNNDGPLQQCDHECSDSLHANDDIALNELQHSSCLLL